jgi:hypothetical protein
MCKVSPLLVLVGSDLDRAAEMVEDDRGLRQGAGEARKIGGWEVIMPGLEDKVS